jgi:hypothetical protein
VIILLPWAALFALAPNLPGDAPAQPTVIVGPISPVAIPKGGKGTFQAQFRVVPGYHINSNQPKSQFLIATVLKLEPPTNILVGQVSYPPGVDQTFPFDPGQPINVYSGDFRLTSLVRVAQSAPVGTYRVHGVLKYQACDQALCYPPRELPVQFDVKVQPAAGRTERHNPGQSPHVH